MTDSLATIVPKLILRRLQLESHRPVPYGNPNSDYPLGERHVRRSDHLRNEARSE